MNVIADTPFMANSYRIVYREYLNKELANEVIIAQLHEATDESIRYVLDKLVERGDIPALDTWFFSMMWTQAMFSAAVIWINCYFNGMSFEKSVEEYNAVADRIVNMAMSGKVP